MSTKQIKLVAALVIAAIALAVFLQNADVVELELLIATVKMRLASALMLAFAIGVGTGYLAFSRWHTVKTRAKTE